MTKIRAALVAAVLTCLAVTGVGPAYASSHGHLTYLASGGVASDRHYKPKTIVLSGDSTLFLKNATWHVWNNTTASASARSGWNDCDPNCAKGTIHWYLTKVTLSKPMLICGRHFFTRVTFHFTHGRPTGVAQDYRWNATPAC
jgi:hypothetical protein